MDMASLAALEASSPGSDPGGGHPKCSAGGGPPVQGRAWYNQKHSKEATNRFVGWSLAN